jgi:TIR domain
MAMKQIRDCAYSAFVSYSNDDNKSWYRWVSKFTRELEQVLGGRARVKDVPPLFFGDDTLAVAGRLSDTLKTAVSTSFAMVIVVHDNYAQSDWCLKELQYFREAFGDEGFRDRLYIVAMSEGAMRVVEKKDIWKQLCPNDDQVWLQFFQSDKRGAPVDVYQGMEDGKGLLSNEFLKPFDQLVADLAAKISRSANMAAARPEVPDSVGRLPVAPPSVDAMPPTSADGDGDCDAVRIYIESNQNERLLWKPLGEQIKKKWDKLVAGRQIAPPLFVRPRGLPIDDIERHPQLDDADGVVLFWGKKEPRSLLSQINKVEDRLHGRDVAPCIVAYLMPPQPDPKAPIVSWAWDVLRFEAETAEGIDVVPDDTSELDAFLQRILERSSKRRVAVRAHAAPGT